MLDLALWCLSEEDAFCKEAVAGVCLLVENVAVMTAGEDTAVNSGEEKRDVGVEDDDDDEGSKENVGDEVAIGVVGKFEVEDDEEEEECKPVWELCDADANEYFDVFLRRNCPSWSMPKSISSNPNNSCV